MFSVVLRMPESPLMSKYFKWTFVVYRSIFCVSLKKRIDFMLIFS